MVESELTDEVLAGFNDKASREQRFLELYQQHDYLTAYARHTDIRVADDPKWAIGRGDEWEDHGHKQRDFLLKHGMTEDSRVLDFGCGVGRAARAIVPCLAKGRYVGIDISAAALRYAREMAEREGWIEREPRFVEVSGTSFDLHATFDMIWAHSVFTHLPDWAISETVGTVKRHLAVDGQFLFTFNLAQTARRTGLKQFRYPFQFFEEVARRHGLMAHRMSKVWPASQRTAQLRWGETAMIK